jgi:hypothetical protein
MRKIVVPLLAVVMLVGRSLAACAQSAPALPLIISCDELLGKPGGIRYLDAHQVPLPTADGAGFCDVFQRLDSLGLNWHLRRYTLPARGLVLEQFFTGVVPLQILEGASREWYASGQLREEVLYHKNGVIDTLRTYYPSGKLRRMQVFHKKGVETCYDSVGNQLPKCLPYHTFATLGGKNTYSGKFLQVVQQQCRQFLPANYQVPKGQVVYYAFRIDPAGVVQEPRVLSLVAPELQAAVIKAIRQLPRFEPAFYEGQATDDILDGFLQLK